MKKKIEDFLERLLYYIFGWAWPITWFMAIWMDKFKKELFFTGLFCIFFGLLMYASIHKKDKDQAESRKVKQ